MADRTESRGPTYAPRTRLWFPDPFCQKPRLRIQNSKGNKSRLEDQKEGSSIRFWNLGSKPEVRRQTRVSEEAGSSEPGIKWAWLNGPDSRCQIRARAWLGNMNAQAGDRWWVGASIFVYPQPLRVTCTYLRMKDGSPEVWKGTGNSASLNPHVFSLSLPSGWSVLKAAEGLVSTRLFFVC